VGNLHITVVTCQQITAIGEEMILLLNPLLFAAGCP
jgi:hypothetical protein